MYAVMKSSTAQLPLVKTCHPLKTMMIENHPSAIYAKYGWNLALKGRLSRLIPWTLNACVNLIDAMQMEHQVNRFAIVVKFRNHWNTVAAPLPHDR